MCLIENLKRVLAAAKELEESLNSYGGAVTVLVKRSGGSAPESIPVGYEVVIEAQLNSVGGNIALFGSGEFAGSEGPMFLLK